MIQVFAVHSAYGLATIAGAVDAGLLGDQERVLLAFNSAQIPELTRSVADASELASLRERFGRVEDLSAILGALHPSAFAPSEADLPLISHLLARALELDPNDLELYVQSPQVNPSLALMSLFPSAELGIIGDGLMTYSPMRIPLPHGVASRITRVVYADVVAGVRPLVGSPSASPIAVPPTAFRRALEETGATAELPTQLADGARTVVVVGQYLAALSILTEEEEVSMQIDMVMEAVKFRPQRVVFKPHPAAPLTTSVELVREAQRFGVELVVYRGALSAELLAHRLKALAIVAGFSTSLVTANALYGIDMRAVGTGTVLRRLTPFENSNRIPATLIDIVVRGGERGAHPAHVQLLIDAVGYVMQPQNARHLRERAEQYLSTASERERTRYFNAERLSELRLPGAQPQKPLQRVLNPAGGVGRAEHVRLTALGARRRLGRAWRVLRGQ